MPWRCCGEAGTPLTVARGAGSRPSRTLEREPDAESEKPPSSAEPSHETLTSEDPAGDRPSHADHAHDWNFQLGDVKMEATYVNGWDYTDCADVEATATLTDLGYEYAVELAYGAEGGDLMVS